MDESAVSPFGIYVQKQRVPDFIAHIKYEGKFGHVQLGGLLSMINTEVLPKQRNHNILPVEDFL